MDPYVTGNVIRQLREGMNLTQGALADKLGVSDKAVSRWETGKGYPDITLLQPLADALGVSLIELLSGTSVTNTNPGANILRSRFYVCPACGNVITSVGEALVSCHGITLPPIEPEEPDEAHALRIEEVEDEYYTTADHPMSKEHYISFIAAIADDGIHMCKLYSEGEAAVRVPRRRVRYLYWYCNRHGLFRMRVTHTRHT